MAHDRSFAQILVLLIAVSATAQVVQGVPNVVIVLRAGMPSDKVDLQGYLYGSFGAFGVHLRAARNIGSVEIQTAVKGKVADRLKLFAWGTRMRDGDLRYHHPSLGSAGVLLLPSAVDGHAGRTSRDYSTAKETSRGSSQLRRRLGLPFFRLTGLHDCPNPARYCEARYWVVSRFTFPISAQIPLRRA